MTLGLAFIIILSLLALVAAAVVDRKQTVLEFGLADTNRRLAETHVSLMREDKRLRREQKELDKFLWQELEVLTSAADAVEHLKGRIDSMELVQDVFTHRLEDGTFQRVSPAKVGGSKGVNARRRK